MNEKRSVAILCDYGVDDAIATLYLLENAKHFDKIDILAIGGNFPLEETFKKVSDHNNLSSF